jgi:hypothetical protein
MLIIGRLRTGSSHKIENDHGDDYTYGLNFMELYCTRVVHLNAIARTAMLLLPGRRHDRIGSNLVREILPLLWVARPRSAACLV